MGIKYPYGLHRGYFCPLIGLFFTHIKEASFPLFGYFVLSYFSGLFTLIPFIHRLFRTFLHYYYFRYFVLLPIWIRPSISWLIESFFTSCAEIHTPESADTRIKIRFMKFIFIKDKLFSKTNFILFHKGIQKRLSKRQSFSIIIEVLLIFHQKPKTFSMDIDNF